ncbi:hypothetical protein L9F63_004050, partial [Diploptera punctata]
FFNPQLRSESIPYHSIPLINLFWNLGIKCKQLQKLICEVFFTLIPKHNVLL